MSTPATVNIVFTRGDSWDLLARVKGRNSSGDLVYLDLTGVVATAQVRETRDSNQVLATITCTLTNQTTMPGGVLCRMNDTVTAAIANDSGVWDLELKWPGASGDRKTVIGGTVTVNDDVTRSA